MNDPMVLAGLPAWKPLLTTLLLPPVPWLLLLLLAAGLLRRRPAGARGLVLVSVLGLWLSCCNSTADWLQHQLLDVPPALSARELGQWARQIEQAPAEPPAVAVVVLGGGRERWAPEYQSANLMWPSLERLRYGLWLGRRLGAPVAFSGGVGWAQPGDAPAEAEAQLAATIAEHEFGQSLRWIESASRDTRENARLGSALLARDGVRQVLLVTHGWHMPRALRAFREAAGGKLQVHPAPMGLATRNERALLRWLPSHSGFTQVRLVLREWLGGLAGA